MPIESLESPDGAVAPSSPDPAVTPGSPKRWSTGRFVIVGVVVGLVAMWGYVLFLAFGPGRQPPIDRLDDPAFAQAAEDRCAEAVAATEELPPANEPDTAAERAQIVSQANGILAVMLEDLDELATLAPEGGQRQRVSEWLADWGILLADRQSYAEALRTDPSARLLVSEKGDTGRHITGWIDEFAAANRMPSCATPTDV